ncbi:MAG: alpha/beta hydrolase [Archangiaceae bacterium]|nr:alpha/beta hydrolase [Archangiaceae bacterium]
MSDGPGPRILETRIEVIYPKGRGDIGLRGSLAPLSWEHSRAPDVVNGDAYLFKVPVPEGEILELKVSRGEDWALGQNYLVHAGEHLHLCPAFDQRTTRLEEALEIDAAGQPLRIDVLLPVGYDEHPEERYSVVYAVDGQSLWSHSQDAFGNWSLDSTLTSLAQVGATEDVILVGIHTAVGRLDLLSPVPDTTYGGGGGEQFLSRIVDHLKPFVEKRYRTKNGPENTGVMGSSMGGLFAFYAAWSRPDVFGKAACLSSSFFWGNRWLVRMVNETPPPSPRPLLYLDSGATPNEGEQKSRDNYHHTRSMLRALTALGFEAGKDLHRLVFPGHEHNAASWASRIALPLQLLFPRVPKPFDESRWA